VDQIKKNVFQLAGLFLAVLIFYVAAWKGMNHLRTRNGPWVMEFSVTTNSTASVRITNHKLKVEGATLVFTNIPAMGGMDSTATFTNVAVKPAFGKFFYQDLTFLPGILTFDFFGHLVEIRPSALVIDTNLIPWSPKPDLLLEASESPLEIRFSNVPGVEN
jgi:hypothetical protein